MLSTKGLILADRMKKPKRDNKIITTKNLPAWEFIKKKGYIDNNQYPESQNINVENIWKDKPAYIVGAGKSLSEFLDVFGWDFLDGKHTIGINHTIEYYDRFEWFFFLDKRFLANTTYNLDNYKGKIFAQNNTGLKQGPNTVLFWCNNSKSSVRLSDGLFSSNFSGLAALNLAIITGANPIYLLGCSMGKGASKDGYHFTPNYNGEVKKQKIFEKFQRVLDSYKQFQKFAGRIRNVTDYEPLPGIQNISIADFKKKHSMKVIPRTPRIIHYSFSTDISIHADITRALIKGGYGRHELRDINEKARPAADLYINEHFISTRKQTQNFQYKSKAIDIVHSTGCIPAGGWKSVIALTETWQKYLAQHNVQSKVIRGGVDINPYESITPTNGLVFGRITRWSPGKIHPEWNRFVKEILDSVPGAVCKMFVQVVEKGNRPLLQHERMTYDETVKISDFKGDRLKELAVYVHANGSFRDTMSHAVIEAMATGLPIIFLKEDVIREVAGPAGVECSTIDQLRDTIKTFLLDEKLRIEYTEKAKAQAKKWDIKTWVSAMNKEIKACLK